MDSRCLKNHPLKLKNFQEFFKRYDALLMYWVTIAGLCVMPHGLLHIAMVGLCVMPQCTVVLGLCCTAIHHAVASCCVLGWGVLHCVPVVLPPTVLPPHCPSCCGQAATGAVVSLTIALPLMMSLWCGEG